MTEEEELKVCLEFVLIKAGFLLDWDTPLGTIKVPPFDIELPIKFCITADNVVDLAYGFLDRLADEYYGEIEGVKEEVEGVMI